MLDLEPPFLDLQFLQIIHYDALRVKADRHMLDDTSLSSR